ncbi:hypothetical protein VFPBJ_04275 [Purpureocillium lilacinum]|uniref:Uncharacterized protein n=1 Tax=Purpureocillium lilacinum TaxID=33203 RepID=A0A179GWS7_PURLI|nr:hypothetical protein VFPBJ_04275 [Purpureocillium lilacinum]
MPDQGKCLPRFGVAARQCGSSAGGRLAAVRRRQGRWAGWQREARSGKVWQGT